MYEFYNIILPILFSVIKDKFNLLRTGNHEWLETLYNKYFKPQIVLILVCVCQGRNNKIKRMTRFKMKWLSD